MGRDKALLPIDNVPMATRVVRALEDAGATEVACVGGDIDALRALGHFAIVDEHPDAGPLGGVLTGVAWASEPITVVAPCDLLLPSAGPFRELVAALTESDAMAAVPIVDGRWRPLPAALRSSVLTRLSESFASGERAVHRAVERLDFLAVDVGALPDADTPEDLSDRR